MGERLGSNSVFACFIKCFFYLCCPLDLIKLSAFKEFFSQCMIIGGFYILKPIKCLKSTFHENRKDEDKRYAVIEKLIPENNENLEEMQTIIRKTLI